MASRVVLALVLPSLTQAKTGINGRLAEALDEDSVCQQGEECSFNALQVQAASHAGDERNVTKPKDWATPKACIDYPECQCGEMCLAAASKYGCTQNCQDKCWMSECSCAPACAPPAGPGCNSYCVANCAECGAEMSSCVDTFVDDEDAGIACLKGNAATVPHCKTCWQQVEEDPCAAMDGVYNTGSDAYVQGSPVGLAARRGYLYGFIESAGYKDSFGSRYLDGQVHTEYEDTYTLYCKGFALFPNGATNLTFRTSNLHLDGTKAIHWSNNITWEMTHPL